MPSAQTIPPSLRWKPPKVAIHDARLGSYMPLDGQPFLQLGGMVITVETITPQIAANLLMKNITNRRLRDEVVEQYAREMIAGKWQLKAVAICLSTDGSLGNGQHTLNAIVKSQTEQVLLVARNCSRESIAAMDIGLKRTLNDVSHFLQLDLTDRRASIAKIVALGTTKIPVISAMEVYELYQATRHLIDPVLEAGLPFWVTAPGAAVLAKAMYTQPRAKIMRFIEILRTAQIAGPNESAALKFRDHALAAKGRAGVASRVDGYQRAQAALHAFCEGRGLTKLYASEVDHFPVSAAYRQILEDRRPL